jgi:hypothetical protein
MRKRRERADLLDGWTKPASYWKSNSGPRPAPGPSALPVTLGTVTDPPDPAPEPGFGPVPPAGACESPPASVFSLRLEASPARFAAAKEEVIRQPIHGPRPRGRPQFMKSRRLRRPL